MMQTDLEKSKEKVVGLIFFLLLAVMQIGFDNHSASATSQDDQRLSELIDGAKKEEKLVLYGSVNIQEASIFLNKFKEKYPFIKPEYYRTQAVNLPMKLTMEYKAKRYIPDVIATNSFPFYSIFEEGIIGKYPSPERKAIPDNLKDTDGYWTAWQNTLYVTGYNTMLVSKNEAPRRREDLLNPKWKGKISMGRDESRWFMGQLLIMGREKGIDYMEKLSKQDPVLTSGGQSLALQLLSAKEFHITLVAYAHGVEEMKSKGAPLDWVGFEPIISVPSVVGIAAHPQHPNAAKLYVDFILSKEGQSRLPPVFRLPVRRDVETNPPGILRDIKLYPMDPKLGPTYDQYVELYQKVFRIKK